MLPNHHHIEIVSIEKEHLYDVSPDELLYFLNADINEDPDILSALKTLDADATNTPTEPTQTQTIENNVPIKRETFSLSDKVEMILNQHGVSTTTEPPESKKGVDCSAYDDVIHVSATPFKLSTVPGEEGYIYPSPAIINKDAFKKPSELKSFCKILNNKCCQPNYFVLKNGLIHLKIDYYVELSKIPNQKFITWQNPNKKRKEINPAEEQEESLYEVNISEANGQFKKNNLPSYIIYVVNDYRFKKIGENYACTNFNRDPFIVSNELNDMIKVIEKPFQVSGDHTQILLPVEKYKEIMQACDKYPVLKTISLHKTAKFGFENIIYANNNHWAQTNKKAKQSPATPSEQGIFAPRKYKKNTRYYPPKELNIPGLNSSS